MIVNSGLFPFVVWIISRSSCLSGYRFSFCSFSQHPFIITCVSAPFTCLSTTSLCLSTTSLCLSTAPSVYQQPLIYFINCPSSIYCTASSIYLTVTLYLSIAFLYLSHSRPSPALFINCQPVFINITLFFNCFSLFMAPSVYPTLTLLFFNIFQYIQLPPYLSNAFYLSTASLFLLTASFYLSHYNQFFYINCLLYIPPPFSIYHTAPFI